ncbi:MAG: hypothetical protein VYA80_03035 [Pseudomonadota bacterium]|nr:hypothetical protein [Pseudomonadota bacterium]
MSENILPEFCIFHFEKDETGNGLKDSDINYLKNKGFYLDTCLRQLFVIPGNFHPKFEFKENIQFLTGRSAYSFMLKTATGLNSKIVGESNILGQFKQGWINWLEKAPINTSEPLLPIMRNLFSESIEIRNQHLQGIGGQSYGSLVRKLLNPNSKSNILIVGAGDLSRSIIPFLESFHLGIWNHQPKKIHAKKARIFNPSEALIAADWASQLVISVPPYEENDRLWFELAKKQINTIVHLGRRRANRGIWTEIDSELKFADLDTIFDLRNSQSAIRSLRVNYARKACQLRATKYIFKAREPFSSIVIQQA